MPFTHEDAYNTDSDAVINKFSAWLTIPGACTHPENWLFKYSGHILPERTPLSFTPVL
jgi:hypothetical protein